MQKYRLELSNREGNFNRMFVEKTPVHVDQKIAVSSLNTTSWQKEKTTPQTLKQSLNTPMYQKVTCNTVTEYSHLTICNISSDIRPMMSWTSLRRLKTLRPPYM